MKTTIRIYTIMIVAMTTMFSQPGLAASEESAKNLAVALGFAKSFKEQKQSIEGQGFKAADQIVARALQGVHSLPQETQKKISKVRDQYLKNVSKVVNVDGLMNMYVRLLAPRLTQQEMDKILAFYSSPVGKKYAEVSAAVTKDFTFRMMSQINEDMIKQVNGMSNELNKIMAAQKKAKVSQKEAKAAKQGQKKVEK